MGSGREGGEREGPVLLNKGLEGAPTGWLTALLFLHALHETGTSHGVVISLGHDN